MGKLASDTMAMIEGGDEKKKKNRLIDGTTYFAFSVFKQHPNINLAVYIVRIGLHPIPARRFEFRGYLNGIAREGVEGRPVGVLLVFVGRGRS